jgi:hypothetical protein
MRDAARRLGAYTAAALLGLAQGLAMLPREFLWPSAGRAWREAGDAAQHAVAQRHFLTEPWGWPPLEVVGLGGVNLAFLDGIPALALPLKLLAPLLPEGFHGVGLFYLLAWALQPVAAVWALRGAGVRALWPSLAVAVMASAMPAFIMRFGHAALTGHFVVLAALGFYLRLLTAPRLWLVAVPFQVTVLLIHPYLALMSLALLGAVPLTLLLRRRPGTIAAMLGLAAAAGAMLGTMAVLGYLGAEGDGGFGLFAMNLLSPAWPHRSWFLGGLVAAEVDATGHGGWEGYNWLGLGLWLAIFAALLLAPRALLAQPGRHPGLALALLGLVALALSFRVGLGSFVLLDLGAAPGFLEQFRASGRFFWPVGYALLIGAAAVLARQGRAGMLALLLAAGVQWLDARPMRAALADWAAQRPGWTVDAEALRPLLRNARSVTILPSWICIPPEDAAARVAVLELLLLASETPRPVSTFYAARWRMPPVCDDAARAARPLAPGELRLYLPGSTLPAPASRCVELGVLRACR